MSSSSPETEVAGEDEVQDDVPNLEVEEELSEGDEGGSGGAPNGRRRISEMVEEERTSVAKPELLENGIHGNEYNRIHGEDEVSEDDSFGSLVHAPARTESPIGSFMSNPDDTPSVQGSILSSPGSGVLPSIASRPRFGSPTPSFRPFDRRFSSRLSPSPTVHSPRASSPYLMGHSRNASYGSQMVLDGGDTDSPSPPWEVIRWTKLKKMNGQAFSEIGKRNFGTPTCICVSASIVLGTSKGIILVFDYHQNLKSIIGPGTKAVESGAITSVAVSADHSTIAGGHADGCIFTWEISKAARPFLHIPYLDASSLQNRTADGHIHNVAVIHLGFLGARHTALVSADSRGMAFSHLATRGTGALGRSVKTTRILGRYPNDTLITGKSRKPSTVLAFAPLPLGNVERGTDTLGLTAMLTPYLLVIVSTTPVAQTQHKSPRPKEVAAHSAMSGCLAWFPAVRLKVNDPITGDTVSKVKLVYCWSNILTVMDIEETESDEKDKEPTLNFKARSRWRSEEAIVAVQWLSRSVLSVLTISQRLIILEDQTMRMTEAFDLLHKLIYHRDIYSQQLHSLVEQLDEEDASMHGVVADAFYMSFKAYKGRMFLLGFNDVSIGAVSNWADRLIALMENGDYIGAIQLATSYYTGDADKLTIGLPEDSELRHSLVRDKLIEIMSASLKFAFGKSHPTSSKEEKSTELRELAEACFVAALATDDVDFIFEEAYEWFEHGDCEGIFFETLEPYILDKEIYMVPPTVVKALVTYYVTQGLESRLEEMICQMETATLDIDQITTLCKQHNLYDALIYIWTQALGDYITPLIDLLTLLIPLVQNGEHFSNGDLMDDPIYGVNALKMFPYMSYTFTGRVYPTGDALSDEEAQKAKAELYWFLFSGNSISWPRGSHKSFRTMPSKAEEPSFPYLRMVLKYDAPSLLSTLNEAFEDSFLNNNPDGAINGSSKANIPEDQLFAISVNRQYIVSILLDVMNPAEFAPEDTIYLDMFIARNLPKFPQYLLLSGSSLHRVLTGLCNYPGDDIAEDAQLSAEYLLSVYHPTDLSLLMPLFYKAGFYRVIKSIYRADNEFAKLIQTYFEDSADQEEVFDCLAYCLKPQRKLSKKQISDIYKVIKSHARGLVDLDPARIALIIEAYSPSLHADILAALSDDPEHEYAYLQTILEPAEGTGDAPKSSLDNSFIERYVQLMCRFDSAHVVDYVGLVQASDLRLEKVLPAMEDSGVIDAAVILMAREGQIREAMDRLIEHLEKLEAALVGLLSSAEEQTEPPRMQEAAEDLLTSLQKYTNVGIWLCQGQTKTSLRRAQKGVVRKKSTSKGELQSEELLWLDFIDTTVQITKSISAGLASVGATGSTSLDIEKLVSTLRTLVQRTFTALLTATSSPAANGTSISFLRILRAFLTRASESSPTISDLRAVLASIFSAYAYEESILSLANRLLDKDLFVNVNNVSQLRQRGWRPRGSLCEGCHQRIWGPGAVGDVFGKWEEKQSEEASKLEDRRASMARKDDDRGKGRARSQDQTTSIGRESSVGNGKGKSVEGAAASIVDTEEEDENAVKSEGPARPELDLGPLIVLACRHIYHQRCLEAAQAQAQAKGPADAWHDGREFRCPIDG